MVGAYNSSTQQQQVRTANGVLLNNVCKLKHSCMPAPQQQTHLSTVIAVTQADSWSAISCTPVSTSPHTYIIVDTFLPSSSPLS